MSNERREENKSREKSKGSSGDVSSQKLIQMSDKTNAEEQLATPSISNQTIIFQDVMLEKRYKWLTRIIVCLILSIVIHMGIAYHIHDKFIELVLNLNTAHQEQLDMESEPIPMNLSPRDMPGYAESVLDSPQIHDAYNDPTPLSTAEEQSQIKSVEQPEVDLSEKTVDLQVPEVPELSDSDKLDPLTTKEAQAPEDTYVPIVDTSIKPEYETKRDIEKVQLLEQENPAPFSQPEYSSTESGSLGNREREDLVSVGVVLEPSVSDMITPTDKRIDIPDNSTFRTPISVNVSEEVDVGPMVLPTVDQPDLARYSSLDLGSETKSTLLSTAASVVPKAKTMKPVLDGNQKMPSTQVTTGTSNTELIAENPSKSLDIGGMTTTRTPLPSVPDAEIGPSSQVAMYSPKYDDLDDDSPLGVRSILSPDEVGPTEAYKQRDPSIRKEMITQFGGDVKINQTIENGLKYVSQTQWPDGRWSFHLQPPGTPNENQKLIQNGNMQCDTAATALALLSMLGAGYTHQDGLYKDEIRHGLDFLIEHQHTGPVMGKNGKKGVEGALFNADTDTDNNSRAYAHAMATTALCEAYGMTRDTELLEPARAAVRYIIATQNKTLGGWRYETVGFEGQPHQESDTSSVGWQVMALRSAKLAQVLPPEEIEPVLKRTQKWLDYARDSKTGRYMYSPFIGVESKFVNWKDVTPAMTAEGMFVQWCIDPDKKQPDTCYDYLLKNLPGKRVDAQYERDSYYWYYCTALMFIAGGDRWNQWQEHIMPILIDSQLPGDHPMGGSWNVNIPHVDKWSHIGGKHYLTTMNLMILEVYVRHLSMYHKNEN